MPHSPAIAQPTDLTNFPRNISSPPPGGAPPPGNLSSQPAPIPPPQQSYEAQAFQGFPSSQVNYTPTNIAQQRHLSMPESPVDRYRSEYEMSRQRLAEVERINAEQEKAWAEQDRLQRDAEKLTRKATQKEREMKRKQELRNRPPPKDSGGQKQPKKSKST